MAGWTTSDIPFAGGRIFNVTEKDEGQYDDIQEVFWASGCALVIRAGLFKDFDGFDGDYFAHSEEIDLCWRLKRAGYKIMVNPKSVIYHVGGGTLDYQSPRKTYLNFRNSLYTLVKNESSLKLVWLIPTRLLMDFLAAGLFLVQGKFRHIWAILKAHFSFYRNFSLLLKKRRATAELVEKNKISDQPNLSAVYQGSVVWQFYVKAHQFFRQLDQ